MAISEQDIVVVDPARRRGRGHISARGLQGPGHHVQAPDLLHRAGKMNRTLCYPRSGAMARPSRRRPVQGRYRGVHRLNRDEDGRVKCVACFMCQTICPPIAFTSRRPAPWDDREKYPVRFDLDELRCIYCGMCEELARDAIELTPSTPVGLTRQR